ncbi:E3 binding domain-containing protein [Patescibacteria group bacterium]|nr:E3 binding domain-containing protein [Patescibacteria group bacterium]
MPYSPFLEVAKFANFTVQDLTGAAKPVEAAKPAEPVKVATPAPTSSAPVTPSTPSASTSAPTGEVRSTPYARTVSKELGVDINSLKGTGPGGRVIAADVIEGQVIPFFFFFLS